MRYAVFLDIDNTLTGPGVGIPDNNRRAVARARELGHQVFINTGRSLYHIPWTLLGEMRFDGVIAALGASIRYGDTDLRTRLIDPDTVVRLVEYFNGRGVAVYLEGILDVLQCGIFPDQPNRFRGPGTGEALREAAERIRVSKLSIVRPLLPEEEDYIRPLLVYNHKTYSETHFPDCNKAEAMLALASHLGFTREQCIAMGDSANDMEMLEAAGHSVIVGDAREDLKSRAEFIACEARYGSVADGLAHYIPEMREFSVSGR
ncbi:MAG: HAD family phosphatase [Clostridia bacterium]|nr:HAD family phosphatase [Clostridia bacterium]